MLPNSMCTQLGSPGQTAPTTLETPIFCTLVNFRFPWGVMAAGPIAASSGPTGLLGKAAISCLIPFGVGTRPPEVLGAPPVRCRSKLAEPKNQILSFQIGPPIEPPNRLST